MNLAKASIRRSKNIVYVNTKGTTLKKQDWVLIQTENELEVAKILQLDVTPNNKDQEIFELSRRCTPRDFDMIRENQQRLKQIKAVCIEKIKEKNLDMKLTAIEMTFSGTKFFLYYTAENRIDFRDLLKDLGSIFKKRIQMVQIGVRDETKIVGALGHCGNVLCCKKFLTSIKPIVIDMAKDQNLPLNPTKISGVCGRLICCLEYEHDFYKEIAKKMPRENDEIKIDNLVGKVKSKNLLKEEIEVVFEDGTLKKFKLDEIKNCNCKKACKTCDEKKGKQKNEE